MPSIGHGGGDETRRAVNNVSPRLRPSGHASQ
jgi:hypothetical protein